MMPRTINPQIVQHSKPPSPKFGSKISITSPQIDRNFDRRSLLDQIINNCERAESPLNNGRKTLQPNKNSLFKSGFSEDKENFKSVGSNYGSEQVCGNRMSYEYQMNQFQRPFADFNKQKRSSVSSSGMRSSGNLQPPKVQQQYYQKVIKQPGSPVFKIRIPPDLPKPRRSTSNDKQNDEKPQLHPPLYPQPQFHIQAQFHPQFPLKIDSQPKKHTLQQQKLLATIAQQRQKHLQHCKRQERKARLYYVQLENKLCELRSKELKKIAEYQSQKLKQYDSLISSIKNTQNETNIQQKILKLDQLKLKNIIKVNEELKPSVEGCLCSDKSGVYFSFDQKNFDFNCV